MDKDQILREIQFKAVRSGGAGGQHVNKVSTKVILSFDLSASTTFTEEEKALLISNLANRLNKENTIVVQSADSRSQATNRELATEKLLALLEAGLLQPKKRKKTRAGKAAKEKRLKAKKQQSEKKSSRKKPDLE